MPVLFSFLEKVIAVLVAAYFMPGIHIDGLVNALILAVVLGLLNLLVKPILFIITLPLNIITLGLFNIVINTIIVLLADYLLPGFNLDNYLYGFLFVIVLWAVDMVFHIFFSSE